MSTGLRAGTNNDGYLQVNGTDVLTALSSGNIGIGTDNPSNTLHVQGVARFNNSSNNLVISTDSGNPFVFVEQSADFIFGTNSTERLRIDSSGNVGIGTNNPSYLLDVKKTDNTTYTAGNFVDRPVVRIHNDSTTTSSFASLVFRTGSGDNAIGFVYPGTVNQADFVICNDGGVNGVERFRITSSGNVGIGSDIPSNALDVNGTIKVYQSTNIATFKNNQLRSDAAGTYYFDHGTTGQSFTFRTSTSSSLDTTGPSITSAGNLSFPSGKGIDFSATSDGAGSNISELLHDYEEGTFNPTLVTNGGSGGVGGYGNRGGSYTKIGRKVTIYGRLTITNKGSLNGSIAIGNLPFACAPTVDTTSIDGWGVLNYFAGVDTSNTTDFISLSNIENTTIAVLYRGNQSGGMSGMDQGHITDTFDCRFGITYQTTS